MVKNETNHTVTIYCARTLLPHLESLIKNAKNIIRRKNQEDIHDVRVAARRIITTLDEFEDQLPNNQIETWNKEFKKITKSFGAVRDLDVQLLTLNETYKTIEDAKILKGVRRVRLRLEQRRKEKQNITRNQTNNIIENDVITELITWAEATLESGIEQEFIPSADLFQLAYKKIRKRLDEMQFFEVFIFDPQRIEELHKMRIATKRLRYAIEIFSDLYDKKIDFALSRAKVIQENLGKIHDADVWIDFLPEFLIKEQANIEEFYGYNSPYMRIKPGIDFLLKNRKEIREKYYQSFIHDWKNWKQKELWLNLRKVIFLSKSNHQQYLSVLHFVV